MKWVTNPDWPTSHLMHCGEDVYCGQDIPAIIESDDDEVMPKCSACLSAFADSGDTVEDYREDEAA